MQRSTIPNLVKLTVMGVGAFVGGYVANLGPHPAQAQNIRTLPATGNQRVQPALTDTFLVPPQGARFVTTEGRPVMIIGAQGNQSTLALFDSGGNPTVTITAGNGGVVNISTTNGANVTAMANNRTSKASLEASSQATQISLERSGRDSVSIRDDAANGSRLTMANRQGKTALDVVFGNNRGTLALMDDSGQTVAALAFGGSNGTLELKDSKKKTSSQLSGEGKLVLTEGEKTLWSAPPTDK